MRATLSNRSPSDYDRHDPYTLKLPEGWALFDEMPAKMVRYDRDGSIGFSVEGMRFLDRLRALATQIGDKPTPGQIVALREALGLTQQELGLKAGVNKLTVSRWERGEISPGPASVARLRKLRRTVAAKGVIVPTTSRRFRSRA